MKINILKKLKWFKKTYKLINYFRFLNFLFRFIIKYKIFLINNFIVLLDIKFQFFKKINFIYLIKNSFKQLFRNIYINYFCFFRIVGLGYRNRRFLAKQNNFKNRAIRIKLGFSHKIYYYLINSIKIYLSRKRFLILSDNFNYLYNVKQNLLSFRKLNDYKLKGFKPIFDIFILKLGKKRKKK